MGSGSFQHQVAAAYGGKKGKNAFLLPNFTTALHSWPNKQYNADVLLWPAGSCWPPTGAAPGEQCSLPHSTAGAQQWGCSNTFHSADSQPVADRQGGW
jgi:hypothetical protein